MADKALLMGINDYKSISDLRGCENDVANVRRLLTETYGFPDANIRQYLSRDVTKQNVIDGFNWLVDGARPGDRLVMHFSGHGSYMASSNDDEDIDELICLYDMDMDDPNSYLLDDDLGLLTRQVPPQVRLTVILDTCHSGTGTRAIFATRGEGMGPLVITNDTISRMAELRGAEIPRTRGADDASLLEIIENNVQNAVLARVYEPDPALRNRRARSPIRRFGQHLSERSASLNHQLLAAAADHQTAADAFIDGDFHGAFSFYLCESARDNDADAANQRIMDAAAQTIRNAGFSQTPQNEGPFLNDPLFGVAGVPVAEEPSTGGSATIPQPPIRPQLPPRTPPRMSESHHETVAQSLRMAEKLIDLADYLARTPPPARVPQTVGVSPRAGNEVVVYVHGISRHQQGYSNPWWDAMSIHLERPMGAQEVLWSPVVNARNLRGAPQARSAEEEALAEEISRLLEDRHEQLVANSHEQSRGTAFVPSASARGSSLAVDDFSRYMLNKKTREEILGIFDETVRPLLESGATVHLISHSWGTVVSWEGLRRLDGENLPGRVENLFVVGSALSMWPVRENLFGRIEDGRKPEHVDFVYNLDAQGDIVGGPINRQFDVNQEFLGLDNLGCSVFDVGCAHGSYFSTENLPVNRDIFGLLINNSG